MSTTELAYHIKEVRDLQKAYFASRNGRFADKKLLDASKLREREIDALVDALLASPDPSLIKMKDVVRTQTTLAKDLRPGDQFRLLGKRKIRKIESVENDLNETSEIVMVLANCLTSKGILRIAMYPKEEVIRINEHLSIEIK